jgi:hypothetical protein
MGLCDLGCLNRQSDGPKPASPASNIGRRRRSVVFWSLSDLAREGHELIAKGWQWRRATRQDLEDAVNDRSLYHSPAGWLIASQPDESMFVHWLATTPTDAPLLFQGLRELLRDEPVDTVRLMSPATAWAVEALQREGFEVKPVLIYSKAV